MQPTVYAAILLAMVLLVLLSPEKVKWSWRLFALCLVFGATSVAALTALGGSSLLVPQFGLIVLVCAAIGLALREQDSIGPVVIAHAAAFMLVVYALLITVLGPRLFAGDIWLIPMRPDAASKMYVPIPLGFGSSNITHVAYLAGSFLTAALVSLVFFRRLPASEFRNAIVGVSLLFSLFGFIDAVGASVGQTKLLDFLRNGNYVMVDQAIDGIKRVSGNLSEPSAFAALGAPLAVFVTEDWLRSRSGRSGFAAICTWSVIFLSTSTTGLLCAGLYAAFFVPRLIIRRSSFRWLLAMGLSLAAVGLITAFVALAFPAALQGAINFVDGLLFGKVGSESAVERGQWAMQGWIAFTESYGLGVGAGSFRSSSWITAVLGSLGIVGAILMVIYLCQIIAVMFDAGRLDAHRTAAWAALFALVPALFSGVTPDPGILFGALAGFALCPMSRAVRANAPQLETRAIALT